MSQHETTGLCACIGGSTHGTDDPSVRRCDLCGDIVTTDPETGEYVVDQTTDPITALIKLRAAMARLSHEVDELAECDSIKVVRVYAPVLAECMRAAIARSEMVAASRREMLEENIVSKNTIDDVDDAIYGFPHERIEVQISSLKKSARGKWEYAVWRGEHQLVLGWRNTLAEVAEGIERVLVGDQAS